MLAGKRILVAPLDWGLGHSTRCVPIIRALMERGAMPIIGADKGPLALLRNEFPDLEHVRIPGADIRYAKGRSQLWSMVRQFPDMVRSVRAEGMLFDRIRHDLKLDAVISDQRFGLRSPDLPSILVTHQVFPFTPIAQPALRKLNLRHIARFDRCWIMDEAEAPGLAGDLSHGATLPPNARYVGTVSRMEASDSRGGSSWRTVAVISGPEPHRTLLEGILSDQLRVLPGNHLLVRGMPGVGGPDHMGNLTRVPHLAARELAEVMSGAELIISRSGYTTLMDLVALGRSALVIPTPGQAEQEYLGELHGRTGRFLVQAQDRVDVQAALHPEAVTLRRMTSKGNSLLERALDDLAAMLC